MARNRGRAVTIRRSSEPIPNDGTTRNAVGGTCEITRVVRPTLHQRDWCSSRDERLESEDSRLVCAAAHALLLYRHYARAEEWRHC